MRDSVYKPAPNGKKKQAFKKAAQILQRKTRSGQGKGAKRGNPF